MNITEGATGAAAGADAENERTPVVIARQASMNITQGATGAAGGAGAENERTLHIYRPDIDGLRTVAVTAVVFFHFVEPIYPGNLPGGFLGVDIFFVISGYLISGIICRQVERGAFSYAGFYAKRIRRIFPTLIIVSLTR